MPPDSRSVLHLSAARRDRLLNTARARRREGQKIRDIAAALNMPRSTVGGWVKDIDVEIVETCALCGGPVLIDIRDAYPRRRYCSETHRIKASNMRQVA